MIEWVVRFLALIFSIFMGCAATHVPLPAGVVPNAPKVSRDDEFFGRQVLGELNRQYPLSFEPYNTDRVERVVNNLARAARGDQQPWHVFVFDDSHVINAAATRGNYIFVWSGLLKFAREDTELATVLAHEVAHLLAGHTNPDPASQANQILAAIIGQAAATATTRDPYSADATSSIVTKVVRGLIVNPNEQSQELEADTIGLFLMADAGYNPEDAVNFWQRLSRRPEIADSGFQFFSSHPASSERIANLEKNLAPAFRRYTQGSKPSANFRAEPTPRNNSNTTIWTVDQNYTYIFKEPNTAAEAVTTLYKGESVEVSEKYSRWFKVSSPLPGYVLGSSLSPK